VLRCNHPDSKYAEVTAANALLPKTNAFQGLTPQTLQQQLPIYVISLARATGRRTAMLDTLAAAGVSNYQLIGCSRLPQRLVNNTSRAAQVSWSR
jgi:hypothetical protein